MSVPPGAGRADHAHFDELAVGWALHALEPEDEALFARHLPDCARCSRTVADTVEVMAAMAADLPRAEPSPGLRARLHEAVGSTEQVHSSSGDDVPEEEPAPTTDDDLRRLFAPSPEPSEPPAGPAPGAPAAPAPAPAGDRVLPPWRRAAPAALAAAAVATILGLGVWNVVLTSARDEAVAVAEQRSAVVDELLRPGAQVAARMTGDGPGRATLVTRDGGMTVVAEGLEVNDPDAETYVLWGVGEDGPQALGTFDVERSGLDVQTVGSAPGAQGYAEYAVSREPGRTPPPAPSEVLVIGQVAS